MVASANIYPAACVSCIIDTCQSTGIPASGHTIGAVPLANYLARYRNVDGRAEIQVRQPVGRKPLGAFELEHIHPVVRGGTNDIRNLQLMCPRCNHRKQAKSMGAFIEQERERAGIADEPLPLFAS